VRAFALAILAITSLAAAPARSDDAFRVYRLSVAGQVLQHWVEDLNGDGLEDIFVAHRKGVEPDETRWLSIFWQSRDAGFGTAPEQSWELDSEAAVLDIGDVAGNPRKEIVFLTGTNIGYYPLDGDIYDTTPVTLMEAQGLTVHPSPRTIPMINFCRDWNGDGRDDVAVATFDGLVLYSRDDADVFAPSSHILIDLDTSIGRVWTRGRNNKTVGITASYTFPSVVLVDYNNDGFEDIIAATNERVIVYLRDESGAYSSEPDVDHLFDVRTQEEKIEGTAELETLVEDLNLDGYADAVVVKQTSKGLTNFRGVINVFWGKAEGFGDTPDQVIISEGTASARAHFIDVNGDNRKDLVLPSVKFSISAIIRILITRSIKVYFNIFLLGNDDRLSERPDFTKEVKFKIDLSGESDEQAMDLEGDYNGDRRIDFVFATDEDELSVYLGQPSGKNDLFSKKPATKMEADAFGELNSPDLNGDGFSDMVIHYPSSKDRKGLLLVLINAGRW